MQNTNEIRISDSELDGMLPILTVGILSFNSAKTLHTTLNSLKSQTLDRRHWRVIFADHGSTDTTLDLIREFLKEFPTIELHAGRENNIAKSRQFVLDLTTTPLLAFIDSDIELPDNWLREAIEILENFEPKVAGVGGPLRLNAKYSRLKAIENLQSAFLGHLKTAQMYVSTRVREIDHLPTAAVLFRRSALLKIKGFDLNLGNCGEDLEIGQRLNAGGFKLITHPQLIVRHHIALENEWQWIARSFRYGRARIRVCNRHWRMWYGFQVTAPLCLSLFYTALIFSSVASRDLRVAAIFVGFFALHCLILTVLFSYRFRFSTALILTSLALLTQLAYAYGELYEMVQSPTRSLHQFAITQRRRFFRWTNRLKTLALPRA